MTSLPYIPTGEEFDEGLEARPGRQRLKRVVQRIGQAARRRTPMHDMLFRVPAQVTAKSAAGRWASSGSLAASAATGTSSVNDLSMFLAPDPAAPATDLPEAVRLFAQRLPRAGLLAAHLIMLPKAADDLAIQDAVRDCLTLDGTVDLGSGFVAWWLASCGGSDHRRVTRRFLSAYELPEPISATVHSVGAQPGPNAMNQAVRSIEMRAAASEALLQLEKKVRDFPSVAPVLEALRRGDVALARRRVLTLPNGFSGAASILSRKEVNAACQAVAASAGGRGTAPVTLPKEWWNAADLATDSGRVIGAAVLAPFLAKRDGLRIERRLQASVVGALDSWSVNESKIVRNWLDQFV